MSKRLIQGLVILLAISTLFVDTYAGGGKRNGTAAAQELMIPVSARGMALSGAYVAGIEGIDAIYYNPAGLGVSNNSAEAMFSYMNYIADIGFTYAAVGMNFEGFGSLGFSVRSLDFGDIPVTNEENPYGTGATFSPTFVTVGVTYSNALTDRIRVGVNVNLISETIVSTSATGFAFDAGVQYNGVAGVEGLKLGVAVKNLGPQIDWDGPDLLRTAVENDAKRGPQYYKIDAAAFELPSQLEMGLAYEAHFSDQFKGVVSTMFQNNNFSDDEYRFAGELSFKNMFFVRGGYTYVKEAVGNEDEFLFGPSFGVGVKMTGSLDIAVDYAYRTVRYFNSNHMITLKLGF